MIRECAGTDLATFRIVDAADRKLWGVDHGPRIIGNHRFESLREAIDIAKAAMKDVLENGMTEAYHQFFEDIVRCHPQANELIIPNGKLKIKIQTNCVMNVMQIVYEKGICLMVPRVAQSNQIGIVACLASATVRARATHAARAMTRYDQGDPSPTCAICDGLLDPSDLHWDHYPHSFADLFDEWRAHERILCSDFEYPATSASEWLDRDARLRWQLFHKHFARLRATHARCNLTDKLRIPFALEGSVFDDVMAKLLIENSEQREAFRDAALLRQIEYENRT